MTEVVPEPQGDRWQHQAAAATPAIGLDVVAGPLGEVDHALNLPNRAPCSAGQVGGQFGRIGQTVHPVIRVAGRPRCRGAAGRPCAMPRSARPVASADGYAPLRREVHIGVGRSYFEQARTALFGWHVHRAAGPKLISSSLQVTDDTVAVVRIGMGPLALKAPVRIAYIINEPSRAGFAYGTLPGHPEQGEGVVHDHDGRRRAGEVRHRGLLQARDPAGQDIGVHQPF